MAQRAYILALCGSLRAASVNRKILLESIKGATAVEGVDVEVFDLHGMPMYDGDVEAEWKDKGADAWPPRVDDLVEKAQRADGFLFACPEYNGGLTAPLKNAIDWISRSKGPFHGKTVTSIGTGGRLAAARSQMALRQVLHVVGAVHSNTEVGLASAWTLYDAEGKLHDAKHAERLQAAGASAAKDALAFAAAKEKKE